MTQNTEPNYSEMKRISMFQAELSLALRRITGRTVESSEIQLSRQINIAGNRENQETK
jgi:hypothetical protein